MVQLAQALGQFFGEKGTGLEILVCGDSSFGANLLMLSCNRKSDSDEVVKGLPELPPELAANLTSTKIDNVLMTKNSPPVQKAAVKPGPARQRCLPQGILGDFPGLSYDSVFSAPATARRRGGRGQGASGRVRLVACCATHATVLQAVQSGRPARTPAFALSCEHRTLVCDSANARVLR
jgi:hypothetical protein